ncbi:MAG: carboxypeptidase-like regulatory domain-containing protein [Deltaproteobacteria bacterium]|nr:carboxypeptidase-like regulatory domain-containing protein [Deltaproteobacteria bacterium]
MRFSLVSSALVAVLAALPACHHRAATHVTGGALGRVVIYRNGVAFYERNARVVDGAVTVHVPRDRVDDFLKSLTVVDRATKKPLSVTIPRQQSDAGSFLTMTLETPDTKQAEVLLTYVTEAPAWKPSYRVVVGTDGKVMLEGWAVVDNTTSEDWKGVLVGVGASSALAFRYDLWSVRQIDRDLLQGEERFAIAPPTGVSPYSDTGAAAEEIAALDGAFEVSFSGSSNVDNEYVIDGVNASGTDTGTGIAGIVTDTKTGEKLPGVTVVATRNGAVAQTALTDERGNYKLSLAAGTYALTFYYASATIERSNIVVQSSGYAQVSQRIDQGSFAGETIRVTAAAPTIDMSSTSSKITLDTDMHKKIPVPGRTYSTVRGGTPGAQGDSFGGFGHTHVNGKTGWSDDKKPEAKPPAPKADDKYKAIVAAVQKGRDVIVEVHGAAGADKELAARGQEVKNRLVDSGIAAAKIHIVPKAGSGQGDRVRVLSIASRAAPKDDAAAPKARAPGDNPVGESHFMADRPMTVKAGTSAMVAMVHRETTGGVVYLYDPISDRGDARFAFKAVRLDNPTGDTLEPGPVTVYGDGRFIGEGITEPVPPKASVVVPFALDKQVVVERAGSESDRIAKLVTVQRGVITAELQHRRATKLTVTSRLTAPTTVYLRHRLESGWTLVDAPSKYTRVGDSQLFQVDLGPGETRTVSIAEATPVQRTFDLGNEAALGMMKVFIEEPDASPQLKAQIEALLATHRAGADLADKIQTLREQLVEYRSRAGELNAQIVTLRAVRTGGDLMSALKTKLAEMSDRIQKTTIELVDTQEKLMLARVKFQNQLADLRLTDATRPVASSSR